MTTAADPVLDTLWYTRCPVPTASGLAHSLGWLGETAAAAGIGLGVLQDAGPELAPRHFDHRLPGLIRAGRGFTHPTDRPDLDRRGTSDPGGTRFARFRTG